MGWASEHIKKLQTGETVEFRPTGNSMKGRVESGQLCRVIPAKNVQKGDIVLCKVKGHEYLHLVTNVKNGQFQIGNTKGRTNGWISAEFIYGKLIDESKCHEDKQS